MKKLFKNLSIYLSVTSILLHSCQKEQVVTADLPQQNNFGLSSIQYGNPIPNKYIVVFKSNSVSSTLFKKDMSYEQKCEIVNDFAEKLLKSEGINVSVFDYSYFSTIQGFSASFTPTELEKLKLNPNISYIEQDRIYTFAKGGNGGGGNGGGTSQPPQTIPAGITRVGGSGSAGSRKAWIIDSGIELTHPDLNINTTLSKGFISGSSGNDLFGHGTHVAGIVGAKNNTIGTVGVAAGCTLIAVRVLNQYGGGTTSSIVAGIDYVGSKAASGDVANISLGLYSTQVVDDAVLNASSKGIYFTIAAGNDGGSAVNTSPARVNGSRIFTVSAMNSNDSWASFSNYGNPPVDYCEPGVNIYSTYIGNAYAYMSGTSMAAPHLAGILLVNSGSPTTSGYVTGDPDSTSDPIGHL